ncbi:triphosphoribosyl-dephospho-CoA synthase CitG [Candidatus Enterococcus ferrettii]|uniref:Probable 2-(5''-triphosphoribosyl)-3'-dephosphocoenzyme-A synthase n=1 Tax=Candidatus Enterococcus ferrettii TaxID=2815324 RepID=A0ABV0EN85_9ENTE|nr:triphosphoribosyl-dephospho-CoA synthase CitG [Enterococcus sp. 665A]MBO1339075.1 triphosphoribosyl-dephospho-CoA synthase CitG [Enterococcus sp. 665A]
MTNLETAIVSCAEKALWLEVALTPKPGLVDRRTNGAHNDMDFTTFIHSIVSLRPFLQEYFELGYHHRGTLPDLFNQLRQTGSLAEKAMLTATNGINTHKGANFSFAVLLGAAGMYLQEKPDMTLPFSPVDTQAILKLASELTKPLLVQDFQHLNRKKHLSYGERLYLEKGSTGIRGEAAAGYPALANYLLPYLRANQKEKTDLLLLRSLIYLMSDVEDSNLLHRGGTTALDTVRKESKKIHQAALSEKELLNELINYDTLLTKRYLSPGGSADLLSLGIYFAQLEGLFYSPFGKKV